MIAYEASTAFGLKLVGYLIQGDSRGPVAKQQRYSVSGALV